MLPMTVFEFVVAALACFRVTVLISRDAGPYRIFAKLRKNDRYSKLLRCPYCVSMWIAAFIVAGFWACGTRLNPVMTACMVFALSGIAIILDRSFSSDHLAE